MLLSKIHREGNRLAAALRCNAQALALLPADPLVLYQQARLLALQNNLPTALSMLSNALCNAGAARATWQRTARADPDFAALRAQPQFQQLLQ